jgi:hypothetical protein
LSSGCTSTCQYPLLRSREENHLAPASMSRVSSILGSGKQSCIWMWLRERVCNQNSNKSDLKTCHFRRVFIVESTDISVNVKTVCIYHWFFIIKKLPDPSCRLFYCCQWRDGYENDGLQKWHLVCDLQTMGLVFFHLPNLNYGCGKGFHLHSKFTSKCDLGQNLNLPGKSPVLLWDHCLIITEILFVDNYTNLNISLFLITVTSWYLNNLYLMYICLLFI